MNSLDFKSQERVEVKQYTKVETCWPIVIEDWRISLLWSGCGGRRHELVWMACTVSTVVYAREAAVYSFLSVFFFFFFFSFIPLCFSPFFFSFFLLLFFSLLVTWPFAPGWVEELVFSLDTEGFNVFVLQLKSGMISLMLYGFFILFYLNIEDEWEKWMAVTPSFWVLPVYGNMFAIFCVVNI